MNQEPTTTDILEAINNFSSDVDQKFEGIDQKFEGIDQKFERIDQKFERIDQRLNGLESSMKSVSSQMVTKDYLDDKLADFKGDLVVMMRKEDAKVTTLAEMLRNKKVLTEDEFQKIITLQPFPRLAT